MRHVTELSNPLQSLVWMWSHDSIPLNVYDVIGNVGCVLLSIFLSVTIYKEMYLFMWITAYEAQSHFRC